MITIRRYRPGDEEELWRLFHNTIRQVAIADYTLEQVRRWAPDTVDPERWRQRMAGINPFIAVSGEMIVGYADVQPSGLIDHFFVHHQWQRRGVGRRLMERIHDEAAALGLTRLHSEVSITARPFYEAHGFGVDEQQTVDMDGVTAINFKMSKTL